MTEVVTEFGENEYKVMLMLKDEWLSYMASLEVSTSSGIKILFFKDFNISNLVSRNTA